MLRPHRILGLATFVAVALLLPLRDSAAQTSQETTSAASHKTRHRARKAAPIAEMPETPPAALTPEQQPPTPPQVTYANGQLTIASSNSTLSQVLQSVQTQTGATFDIPPGAGNERVVASLGPGKPQNVLASLLNGSKFNYVILGQANNPGAVQKVILMAKVAGPSNPQPNITAQNSFRPPPPPQPQAAEPSDDEYQQNEPEVENQNQPVPGGDVASQEVIQPGNRTPEQMLEELQRMQQQQQQMQQQLNPANQQPFGQPFNQQSVPPGTPLPSQPSVTPRPQ